ncbi:MAG TPA: tRNA pseudouridine(13) synthase TruD [Gammaproteobacteria bacterium]|nr:tRNA pseudouridine(13) synthase TruD [Gammaproteobacteria bacterium]
MDELPNWARAYGPLTLSARIRAAAEDFRVDEVLGFAADGDGPHVLLHVEKRGANTHWVAEQLARHAGISPREVGYAGLKDRHAVTTQHFTLPLDRKPEPDWSALGLPDIRVLKSERHRRKLKTGSLEGNRFRLVLRGFDGPITMLMPKLEAIKSGGVPNYFGEQRFGRGAANIQKAEAALSGKLRIHDRRLFSLLLSTARSLIFNDLLSARVEAGNWNKLLSGEVMMLDGTHSVFRAVEGDPELSGRLQRGDVHPTGPLWGRGEPMTSGEVQALEAEVAARHPALTKGLAKVGVDMARRSLRLAVRDFAWQTEGDTLILEFFLPAGAYATTVLRELVQTHGENEDVNED